MRFTSVILAGALALYGCGGSPTPPNTAASEQGDTFDAADGDAPASGTPSQATSETTTDKSPERANTAGASDDDQPKGEFALQDSKDARTAKGATPSKLKATRTEAVLKFFVVDKEKGPIPGIVISLTAPDGAQYTTDETDVTGYAEVLVPVGKKYDLVYVSLGRQDIAATVPVPDEPNQNIKLTLRYKRFETPPKLVLDGVNFDTGKASLRSDSYVHLDRVVDFLKKKRSARIEISGHTDNVGIPKNNKALSERRAQACKDYLLSQGIEAHRIEARGYGDERPVASNDTEQGRQLNRRIEATEL